MKKPLVLLLILLFLNVLVWFFYVPKREGDLSRELSEYKIVRDKKAKEKLLTFQDIYETKDKIGEYEKRLRTREDFSKIINYIFEKSFTGKVDIKTINYSFEEKKDLNLTRLILTIGIEGNYESIKRFLYELEGGSHFIMIDNLKIQKGNDIITGSIILTTYLKGVI
ncbi:MAG: type II secretion system protein M [Proteobacteria bacterium]|nr:type II secretion system protein M [Pseudomonadota bacterium]